MKVIVSTCGTSILTNKEKDMDGSKPFSVLRLSNEKENQLEKEGKEYLDTLIKDLKIEVEGWRIEDAKKNSAEINGLLTFYKGLIRKDDENMHYFIHSDTYVGEKCAELVVEWCRKNGLRNSQRYKVPGLNTADYLSFSAAMSDLARWCADVIPPMRSPHNRVAFNLTGGFKSLQGFMQTLGMFYADEIFYLFESASRLMIIPRLPVNIDDAAFAEIEEHFDNYRKMSIGIPLPGDSIKAISASMILRAEDDGDCVLSPWGTILWDKFIEKHYEKEIYSPPIPEIILKNSFFSDTSRFKQDGGRLSHINQRIDDLAKFLLLKTKLKRLSFGKIEDDLGKKTGCTHEFYAWGDGAAYRFYGRYRADKFEVIHLLKHTKR